MSKDRVWPALGRGTSGTERGWGAGAALGRAVEVNS